MSPWRKATAERLEPEMTKEVGAQMKITTMTVSVTGFHAAIGFSHRFRATGSRAPHVSVTRALLV